MNKKDLIDWISDNKSKFLALIIYFIYLAVIFFGLVVGGFVVRGIEGGGKGVGLGFLLAILLLLPLVFILFCDTIGKPFGGWTDGYNLPNQETPGCLIAFVGWILLLMPLVLLIWHVFFK